MKALPWIILVLISVVFGYSYAKQREADARWREHVANVNAELDSVARLAEELRVLDSALSLEADSLRVRLSASRIRLDALGIQNDSLAGSVDSLVDMLIVSDSLTGTQIGTAISNLRGEITLCRSTLGICDSLNGVLSTRIGVLDSLHYHNSATITTLRVAWDEAVRRSKQSNWGLGATCGYAANQAGAGLGCAVGLSYRVRLPRLF